MNKKKHILVIAQYFYPEQFRVNDICIEWVKQGYKVTVVTGIPNYPQGKFYDGYGLFKKRKETWNGIEIIRISIIPRGNNSVQLALNYGSFVLSGFVWELFTKLNPDVVFIYEVSPMTQALVGVWMAKKRKIPCYIYVTDLWPENFEYITGIHHRFIIKPIEMMVDYIYRSCKKIFVSSKSFIKSVEQRNICSEKVIYWPQYAEDFYYKKDLSEISVDSIIIRKKGKFQILFAGNIGEAQGLDVLIETASNLKNAGYENVLFCIVGDGRYKETLKNNVNKANLNEMFDFHPRLPAIKIPDLFAQTDASLICLSKSEVFAITLPAKTQSCMACGKPIVVCADGEIQQVVSEAKCGVVSNAGDAVGLSNAIIQLLQLTQEERNMMSLNAINYYKKNFDKKTLLKKMDQYLELQEETSYV